MLNRIAAILRQNGYTAFDKDMQGVYVHDTVATAYLVTLGVSSDEISIELYENIQKRIEFLATMRYQKQVKVLHLLVTENGMFKDEELNILEKMNNIWFISADIGRVYVFEKQIQNFDQLYDRLEVGMNEWHSQKRKEQFRITPVNISIVILNILYFVFVIISQKDMNAVYDTDVMLKMGALSYDTFMSGAWYQIITSMFLHFGISHLINNMILLTYVGCELERRIGSVAYLVLYLVTGICGNVASLVYYHLNGSVVVSAGASGAIFGVMGALIIILVIQHTQTPELSPRRLVLSAVLSIYYGITTIGVDNAAHIGGFISGIIGGFLLSKISQYGKLE